jgi:nucleotide-binding universal stress UspA family protein
MALIVVGVDGSEASDAALRFAADEAAVRGASLRVVCAGGVAAAVYAGTWGLTAEVESGFERNAKDVTALALTAAARLQPGIDCESRTVRGHPADVLVQESTGADLLVVGSRGLGGFKSLVLGSVSAQVAHHATCPVVIVPPPEQAATGERDR